MKKIKSIRFVESFMLLPMITMAMPFGMTSPNFQSVVPSLQNVPTQTEYIEANALLAYNQAEEQKQQTLDLEAQAVDAYFKKHHMPLYGTGPKMVEEANKYDMDWRLMPAIAVRESTGGKHACTSVPHSFFGWGSCKIGFSSDDEAIEALASNLSGNEKSTAMHYSGKTTREILEKYNPPSVVEHYADQVIRIMDSIGPEDMNTTPDTSESSYVPLVQKG